MTKCCFNRFVCVSMLKFAFLTEGLIYESDHRNGEYVNHLTVILTNIEMSVLLHTNIQTSLHSVTNFI